MTGWIDVNKEATTYSATRAGFIMANGVELPDKQDGIRRYRYQFEDNDPEFLWLCVIPPCPGFRLWARGASVRRDRLEKAAIEHSEFCRKRRFSDREAYRTT